MRIPSVLAAALLSCASSLALAGETTVSFPVNGQKVVGTLNLPDGVSRPPVVLLLHGFTGSRHELQIPSVQEGIFARAARLWSEQGIASLRIDCRGSGESDGDFADTTLDGQIEDGLAALDYLAARGDIDANRMAIAGWSMGGAVGSAVAARTGHTLDGIALWAPGTNLAAALTFVLGAETMKKGLAAGDAPVEATLPWGGVTRLKGPFFESLFRVDPVAEITGYPGPLLVVVGSNDEVVFPQPESGQVLLDYHPGEEELLVWPMDHAFDTWKDTETVDRLINSTGAFFARHFH